MGEGKEKNPKENPKEENLLKEEGNLLRKEDILVKEENNLRSLIIP